jgi:hypothetical protein
MSDPRAKLIEDLTSRFNSEIISYLTSKDFDEDDEKQSIPVEAATIFIQDHKDDILEKVNEMIKIYEEDETLYLLNEPELDWIREYIYDYQKLHIAMDTLCGRQRKLICKNPINQPIYEALIKKADTYPFSENYKAAAVCLVAENVLDTYIDLYQQHKIPLNHFRSILPNCGPGCESFISNFIETGLTDSVTNSGILSDNYEYEMGLREVCTKRGWKYTSELLNEFLQFIPTCTNVYILYKNKYTKSFENGKQVYINVQMPRTEREIAYTWADRGYSLIVKQQQKEINISKAIYNYCKSHNITYSPKVNTSFYNWFFNVKGYTLDTFDRPTIYVKKYFDSLPKSFNTL